MSQLLQVATRLPGAVEPGIPILSGITAPDYFDQGIPYVNDEGLNKVAVDVAAPSIAYHWQGLPFTTVGRLAIATDKIVARIAPGGAPFEAITELIVFGSGAIDHYSHGIPYTATTQLKAI